MTGRVRRRVLVSGRVQGVFYRNSAQREAEAAGVAGWVRNLDDGRVEAVFEGDPVAVERLVAWAHEGPRKAHVASVWVVEEPPVGESAFEVR
jgi:acylphosphatase